MVDFSKISFENKATLFQGRQLCMDFYIKPTRADERFINHFKAICCGDHQHPITRLKSIQL